MPKKITHEELESLRDFHGQLPKWDSDREEAGYEPPMKVRRYIEERDKALKQQRKDQREAFIKESKAISSFHCREKEKKRQAHLKAEAEKKKAFHKRFLREQAKRDAEYAKVPYTYDDDSSIETVAKDSSTTTTSKKSTSKKCDDDASVHSKKSVTSKKSASNPKKKTTKKKSVSKKSKLPVQKTTLAGYVINAKVVKTAADLPWYKPPQPLLETSRDDKEDASTPNSKSVSSNKETPTVATVSTMHTPSTSSTSSNRSGCFGYSSMKPTRNEPVVHSPDVDLTRICKRCGNQFKFCFEYKLRDICLHSVLDYFEEVGEDNVTETAIKKRFYSTFLSHMKAKILKRSKFWELDTEIHIPPCMMQGSFKEALELRKFNSHYHFLMTRRVHDVQNHIVTHVNNSWNYPKEGERIVQVPACFPEPTPKPDYMD